jgi:hypothetical protein
MAAGVPAWFESDDPWATARMRQYAEIVAAEKKLGQALSKALAALLDDAATALLPSLQADGALTAADSWGARLAQWAKALAQFVIDAVRALFSKRYRAEINKLPPDKRPPQSTVDKASERYAAAAAKALSGWPDHVLAAAQAAIERGGTREEIHRRVADLLTINAPDRDTAAAIEQLDRTANDPDAKPGVRREARARAAALRRAAALPPTADGGRRSRWQPKVAVGARGLAISSLNGGTDGGAAAYTASGGEPRYKQWWSMEDARVRAAHREAHGQIRELGQHFRVGGYPLSHPGDPTAPPELTANCRCGLFILSASEADRARAPSARTPSRRTAHSARTEERTVMATPRTIAPPAEPVDPAPAEASRDNSDDEPTVDVAGAAVQPWHGVLAPLDTPSGDGRMLASPGDGEASVRTMPLPLLYQAATAPGHDNAVIVGRVDRAWIENNTLMGEGVFNLASDAVRDVVRDIDNGFHRWVSVRLDKATYSYHAYRDGQLVDPAEVEAAAAAEDEEALRGLEQVEVADPWRLMSVTLVAEPAFQEAVIGLVGHDQVDEPDEADEADDADEPEPVRPAVGVHATDDAETLTQEPAASEEASEDAGEGDEFKRKPFPPKKNDKTKNDKEDSKGGKGDSKGDGEEDDEDENLPPWLRKKKKGGKSTSSSSTVDADALAADALAAAATGDTSLPIADRNAGWDGPGARSRLAKAGKLAQGCLYKDTSGDPKAAASYKLPFADVTGGSLKIIPKGVFAAAAALGGARGGTSLPDSDVSSIKSKLSGLYSRMAKQFNDESLRPPWDKNSGSSAIAASAGHRTTPAGLLAEPYIGEELDAMRTFQDNTDGDAPLYPPRVVTAAAHSKPWAEQVASAVPLEPPADWFANPELTGPTKIRVSNEGRVYGYIASWETTHAALPGVKPPRNPDPTYARFHRHPVRCDDGSKIKTGPLATGGHADVNASDLWAVMQHYDNPSYVVADVVCGEDEYGIWVSGALRPGVSPFQVLLLDRYSISGDWRNQELVAACAVSVPGFHLADDASVVALAASAGADRPVLAEASPRSRTDEDGDVVALVAAGIVRPQNLHVSGTAPALDGAKFAREMFTELRALATAEPGVFTAVTTATDSAPGTARGTTPSADPDPEPATEPTQDRAQQLQLYRSRVFAAREARLRRRVHERKAAMAGKAN